MVSTTGMVFRRLIARVPEDWPEERMDETYPTAGAERGHQDWELTYSFLLAST